MWSEIQNKRNKFANQIRKKQRQTFFELNREWNHKQLPAVSFLPVLMQNQLYEDIEQILDQVEPAMDDQINSNLFVQLRQKHCHHADAKVRLLMFKLLNRLQEWKQEEVKQGMQLLKEGNNTMLKQFCLYFEYKGLICQNSIPFGRETDIANIQYLTSTLNAVFVISLNLKTVDIQHRVFWLDIVAKALQFIEHSDKQLLSKFDQLFIILNLEPSQQFDEFEQIRVINIIYKLANLPEASEKIIQIQYFGKLMKNIKQQSWDIMNAVLEISAMVMNNSDIAVEKLALHMGFLQYLQTCCTHVSASIKAKAFWALSNIAGSQHYHILISNSALLQNLFNQANTQSIKNQKYFCVLNLLCSCTAEQGQTLQSKYAIIDVVCQILRQINEPKMKDLYFERLIYALYHLVTQWNGIAIELERRRVQDILQTLYSKLANKEQLEQLNMLLDAFEKAVSSCQEN